MRVTFLSETSPSSTSGSAQTHRIQKLRKGLEDLGVQTSCLSLREMTFRRPTLAFPLNYPLARSRLADSDFVHAVGDAAYAASLWKYLSKGPVVVHDVDADTLAEAQLHWELRKNPRTAFHVLQESLMNRIAYRLGDYFVTVSNPLLERLTTEKGVPRDRVHLVRNGVDTDLFRPVSVGAEEVFTVCYAGGTHPWQGLEMLAEAARLLRGDRIRFLIVGFRPEDRALREKIASSLGESALLLDRVGQEQLVGIVARAHCCIIPRSQHPAVHVAFPTKFSEYLAMGKAVIVTDVDETASLVRSHRCGLVGDASVAGLVTAVREAAALRPGELEEMGRRGRVLAESTFDWTVVSRDYLKRLESWQSNAS